MNVKKKKVVPKSVESHNWSLLFGNFSCNADQVFGYFEFWKKKLSSQLRKKQPFLLCYLNSFIGVCWIIQNQNVE